MAGMSQERMQALFAQEAELRLAELADLLLRLESSGGDETLLRSIFREIHTVKGSAAVAGLENVSAIAHELEQFVDEIRSGQISVTPDVIDTLLAGADELRAAITGSLPATAAEQAGSPVDPPVTAGTDGAATGNVTNRTTASSAGMVMIPLERLDELTRLIGETASAHLRVGQMFKDRFNLDPQTCTEFNELSRSLNNLQDHAMRAQMVPISTITEQLHRAVRDLARAQGKDIQFRTQGADTELDRGVLQQLSDSLLHLVRNAVDHGIESPGVREQAGKPGQATIQLHAMQLGSEVIITVTDDGRGIDIGEVRRQAQARGVETESMTDDDVLQLIFEPGLSTTQYVTDVSGRGVGLDVVRTKVDAAHGRVEIRSESGVGAEFRIIVPITVAVLRCLLVEAGGQSFALPFHRVLLSQAYDAATVAYAEGRPAVWVDGQAIAVGGLAQTLGLSDVDTFDGPVVVLADTARRYAFGVDRLIGQRDVVIKALNPLLSHVPVIAGASVEPDGSILIVLDPPGLIERARSTSRRHEVAAVPLHPSAPRRSVLVVDDALTVRELQRSILERAGFDVRVATDGEHALSSLAEYPSDLVLTDIEMPNMDGFALTEAIRSHPTLANIPVLILSSRSSDADRQRGLDAGADGYITKSGFDETGLLTAVNRVLGAPA